uniref:RING-type domain-containing protein n=1 Tax=Angiostrongylus cantonensis TaxID=6313 RepID=A0A0K0D9E8_ANGCA
LHCSAFYLISKAYVFKTSRSYERSKNVCVSLNGAKSRSTLSGSQLKMITCDGPCGHTYSPKAMNVLGRCGHFLCNNCHGLVYNDDGTKGCSNFQCVFATLYDYLPEDSARKAYENQVSITMPCKILVMNVFS